MRTILVTCTVASAAPALASVPVLASPQRLSDSLGQANDAAGYAVAAAGDLVLVGSRGADPGAQNAGKVCVFRRSGAGWIQAGSVAEPFPSSQAQFGRSLAVSEAHAVIGARSADGSGRAWVHARSAAGVSVTGALLAAPVQAGDGFGESVAIDGDWIAVGAPMRAGGGAVEIFRRSGSEWTHVQTVAAVEAANAGLRFGASVALAGSALAVGCPGDATGGTEAGGVRVFRRDLPGSWEPEASVTAGDAAAGDLFGAAVALSGDRLLVGAYRADGAIADAGAAYVFRRSGSAWNFAQKLAPENSLGQADFGYAVAMSGDAIAVGAPAAVVAGSRAGTVYLYREVGSQAVPVLRTGGPGGIGSEFSGTSVALTPQVLAAGAPLATTNSPYAGAAIALDYAADCDADASPDALEIATGASDLNGDGIPDACQCTGDLNGDGSVGGQDLGVLLGFWGTTASTFPRADINRDGLVTGADLGVLLSQWGPCG